MNFPNHLMLTLIQDLPEKVLGVSAEGEVTGTDYETVLISAVDNKYDKMGMNHLAVWEKIALVSDLQPINVFAKFFGYMVSCEIQVFKEADLQKAKLWIVETIK